MQYRATHKGKPHFSVWIMRIAAVLGCLTIVSAYMLSGMYARYSTSASGSDSARVARFSISENLTEQSQTIVISMAPGDASVNYPITVTSNSEVTVKYTLELIRETNNLPLSIAITEATGTIAAGDTAPRTVNAAISWAAGDEAKNYRYSQEIDLITVRLTVEQVN